MDGGAVEPRPRSPLLSGGQAWPPRAFKASAPTSIPGNYDASVVDEVLCVSTEEAGAFCRRLAREEGLLCGISSGAAVCAALSLAGQERFADKKQSWCVLPDTGERYLVQRRVLGGAAMGQRIVVGMSGGVDSSVAALLLKQQGFDVVGVFMKNWEETDENGVCLAPRISDDVRDVCQSIGIPYYSVNFVKEYWDRVFFLFPEEYKRGRTPIRTCSATGRSSFAPFFGVCAAQRRREWMATGHFCRIGHGEEGVRLLKGADPQKGPILLSAHAGPSAAAAGPVSRRRDDQGAGAGHG